MKTHISFWCFTMLVSLSTAVWAQTNTGDSSSKVPSTAAELMIDPNCLESDEVCQQRAAQQEQLRKRCTEDPTWCAQRRDKLKQLHAEKQALEEQCKAQPAKCEELRAQFKQKQSQERQQVKAQRQQLLQGKQEEVQKWCKENPGQCELWKAELAKLQEECQQKRQQLKEKYGLP